jgi:hypothetical protein
MNDGSCSVDVNFEATCACNGEWSGYYCSELKIFNVIKKKGTRYFVETCSP